MSAPPISVALPVYNGAAYLEAALTSILGQDFGDFHLVVSDNCSTDDTPAILARHAQRDARVRVFRSPEFLPQPVNVNRAVSLCTSEWVKLFCHDDLMDPGCLRVLHRAVVEADNPALGLVGNGEEWLFQNGHRHRFPARGTDIENWRGPDLLRSMLRGRSRTPLPSLTTAFVRKEAWQKVGGFDARFVHFDVFFWAKLLVEWDYLYVRQVLTTDRIHGAQVATNVRRGLRSVDEQRTFWPEFVREYGDRLELPWSSRAAGALKGLGMAGMLVGLELIKRRPRGALRVASGLPRHWLPALPLFVARSIRAERAKLRSLLPHVPLGLIYPD
jgi:glycosyltransferase involved in cell wall biosynthesis